MTQTPLRGAIAALVAASLLHAVALPAAAQSPAVTGSALERAAAAPGAPRWDGAIASGRAALSKLMADEGIPGLSVAVLVDGQVVWSEGFGFADLEQRVPATPLTRFRIGSVSKPVTAAAVGLLAQEGKLDLDAPVQRYVPGYPRQRWPITTRQVAGHIAGIRHYDRPDEMLSSRHYADVRSALSIFENDTLRFEPGTKYSYSSYGWNLVSAVVEGAAGEPFLTFMRRRVFEPLGLRSIVAEHQDSVLAWRARFYERLPDGRVNNAPYVDQSNKWAGGGFVSNSEDLVRFGWAHVKGGLLEPRTVTMLVTPQRLRSGESTGYGIGWRSGADSTTGRRWFAHTGSSVGGRAVLLVRPEEGVVVAALANLSQAPMSEALAQRLARPFIEARAAASR
ncbi:MAG TPA: serine hydrolase domain-containing protein [Gemmatimonadaceae bacterium]|nr:serine hydrolase domain-containing protein [Gemmatimonadaceae bacterium]